MPLNNVICGNTIPDPRPGAAYRRDPEQKRLLLLTAAEELFGEQGFDATSTAQIATHAGVSEGILFHHFGSKKGLFTALGEQFALAAAAASMPSDHTQITEESVVRGAFAFAENNPSLYNMMAKGAGELTYADIHAQNDLVVDAIEKNLTLGMRRGDVRQGDAKIMAQLQFAVVDAAINAWRNDDNALNKENYIQEAINCMRAMLAPNTKSNGAHKLQENNR